MLKWLIAVSLAFFAILIRDTWTCNEAVCGAIVSKCLLTQSCKCDRKEDCFCCKDCLNCLGYLYQDCCSCVDMCPEQNDTINVISKQSNCQDLDAPVTSLFQALVSEPDPLERWNSTTFPVDIDVSQFDTKNYVKIIMRTSEQDTIPKKNSAIFTMNCTVAYWAQCISLSKCLHSCQTMGASAFRWFHNGCCECIGEHCINYGINESRCSSCPRNNEIIDEEDLSIDYGDDEDEKELED